MSKAEKTKRPRRPLAILWEPKPLDGESETDPYVREAIILHPRERTTSRAKLRTMWLEYVEAADKVDGTAQIISLLETLPKVVRRQVVEFER